MYLQHLFLKNFRNYEEASVDFDAGVNVIVGDNAQGKSNLLEAVYFLMTGTSFRTTRMTELIRHGEKAFFLEARFQKHGVSQSLRLSFDGRQRRIIHNHSPRRSFKSLLGLLPGGILSPEDHALVKGSPSVRRKFLDVHLSQADPLYVHHLVRYHRALQQRNVLLKKKQEQGIASWEAMMAGAATYLMRRRREEVERLQPHCTHVQHALSQQRDVLTLAYKPSLQMGTEEETLDFYARQRRRELLWGYTLAGPHRDDVTLSLQGKEARAYASEGQQRCCVAALRLAEWQCLAEESDEAPLMAVDDLATSLDADRSAQLLEQLQQLGQVFLTTPHDMPSLSHYTLTIEKGQVHQRAQRATSPKGHHSDLIAT